MSGGNGDTRGDHARQVGLLLRELYFNRTGVLLLVMSLAAAGMYALSVRSTGRTEEFWIALATGVLGAAIFAFAQVALTTRQYERFLGTTVKDAVIAEIAKAGEELTRTYRSMQEQYVPTTQYPASQTPDVRFNRDVNLSMRSSTQYTFRGLTGKYAICRLASLNTIPRDVRLIIADPTRPAAMDSRARREMAYRDGLTFEQARQALVDGVHLTLVGAYLTRVRFDRCEICLTADPNLDRVEIFDDDIYLALFTDTENETFPFPLGLRFNKGSLLYQTNQRECSRLLASPYAIKFEVPKNLSEFEYCAFLQQLGVQLSHAAFLEFRDRYEEFLRDTAPQMMTASG
ncbi:hypothetical protein AB0I66_41580 [Streptomyces sp. NPDC050439]|uniref:hypothetical protein n=1 Tax=unclassified Streptomyces TaxID=2593676 RepID=UPI00341FB2B5